MFACILGPTFVTAREARADGDPASDFLLANAVFYPYSYPVSPGVRRRLDAEMAVAARAGFPLRVALIASPVDLGTASSLFGRPQAYASFLNIEIAYRPVLVVMPNGFGAAGLGGPVRQVLEVVPRPAGGGTDALARSAITAAATLARAVGHPLPGFSAIASGGEPSAMWIALAAGICALAAVAAATAPRARRWLSRVRH